jgi:hypothetical protein
LWKGSLAYFSGSFWYQMGKQEFSFGQDILR